MELVAPIRTGGLLSGPPPPPPPLFEAPPRDPAPAPPEPPRGEMLGRFHEPDVTVSAEIDSVLTCCMSPTPYVCKWTSTVYTRPKYLVCRNDKLTAYLERRDKFLASTLRAPREPRYRHGHDERLDHGGTWYEAVIASVDHRLLKLLFQIDDDSPVVRNIPYRSTPERHGRVRVALNLFVDKIVKKALNDIPPNRRSARDGARYFQELVDMAYSVFHEDWNIFADKVAIHLAVTNVAEETGLSVIRFYTHAHGLRMTVDPGQRLLAETVDVDNEHVDIVQIHRATSLSTSDENETLLVNFRQLAQLFIKSV